MKQELERWITRVHYDNPEADPITRLTTKEEDARAYYNGGVNSINQGSPTWSAYVKIELFLWKAVFTGSAGYYSDLILLDAYVRKEGKPIREYNKPVKEAT